MQTGKNVPSIVSAVKTKKFAVRDQAVQVKGVCVYDNWRKMLKLQQFPITTSGLFFKS